MELDCKYSEKIKQMQYNVARSHFVLSTVSLFGVFMAFAFRKLFVVGLVASSSFLTGCMSMNMYVDTATKEIAVAEMKKVAAPKPVAISFEFQTNGKPNAAATDMLKEKVVAQVKESGLFSAVDATPGNGVNMLNIVINNVPITKDAASQGFATGLTFGLAGTTVTDGYVSTVRFLPAGKTEFIVTTAKHAIHTTIGNTSAPANAGQPLDGVAASTTMTRQILSNNLRDLAANPGFN
jgi:hypothetical protein